MREENSHLQRNQMILQEYMHEKEVADGFDEWLENKQKAENENIKEKENDKESSGEKAKD